MHMGIASIPKTIEELKKDVPIFVGMFTLGQLKVSLINDTSLKDLTKPFTDSLIEAH